MLFMVVFSPGFAIFFYSHPPSITLTDRAADVLDRMGAVHYGSQGALAMASPL
jgi:hypothetical protein